MEDVLLYDELAVALREAGLTAFNAGQLAAQLANVPGDEPGRRLRLIEKALPSLAVIELMVSSDARAKQRVERMLLTILAAVASGRSQSGVIRAVNEPQRSRHSA